MDAAGGIAAVANRIRERALQLDSSRAEQSLAQAELDEARSTLSAESRTNASVRMEMLTSIRSRHGAELELLHLQEKAAKSEAGIEEIAGQARDTRKRAVEIREKWESVASEVYAPHEVEAELYRRTAEGKLRRREERQRKREEKIDDLAHEAEMYREEATSMHRERERLRYELREMDEREEKEDEEIAALAMQIRATLKKKSSLRDALQDAKERHRKANDHMLRWEQECTRFARR